MDTREVLEGLARERILLLDGGMGSLIQGAGLTEKDFRGSRFAGHPGDLAGCTDLLCLTKPEIIENIHTAYLSAGADIIETCSFGNGTAVTLGDYGLEALAYEISRTAAEIARAGADRFSTSDKPRFVAGSMGPLTKSGSLSPDLQDPGKRGISWDAMTAAYYDNARGLLDGGADLLILETIFDTLNAKAGIFAISRLEEERGVRIPLMLSATVSDAGGRLLSGQTLAAFCVSVLPAEPWSLGLNCSLGAARLKPYLKSLADFAPCLVSAHPNAGMPNEFGLYDDSPAIMGACLEEYMQEGLVNIVGGCCGSTPDHIRVIGELAAKYPPRRVPGKNSRTLSKNFAHFGEIPPSSGETRPAPGKKTGKSQKKSLRIKRKLLKIQRKKGTLKKKPKLKNWFPAAKKEIISLLPLLWEDPAQFDARTQAIPGDPEKISFIVENIFSTPEKIFSDPEKFFSEMEKILSVPEKFLSATEKILAEKEKFFSAPEKILSALDKNFSALEKILSGPEKNLSAPEKILSGPEKILSGPEKILSGPEKNFSAPEKNLSMAEKVLAETDKFSAGADKIFSETDRFLDETERLLFDPEKPLSDPEVFSGLEERIWAETKKLFSETDRVLGDAKKFMKQTDRLLDEAEETLEKIEGRPKISPKRRRRAGKRRRGPKNFRKGRERAGDFGKTFFSGLEPVEVRPLVKIGERTNVAGSRLFLKFIQEEAYEKALGLAREMIDQGAQILNVCMDDPLLDAPGCLTRFLTLALSDPDIAKVPIMLDSSRWETLETGLKLLQGKGIVNSLSLKDGESEFLRKARLARRYGAAIMVMLFDEKGQAATFPRKIEVAGRAYRLLTAAGIPPEDILFDAVVLTIATGIPDHDRYALDFFKACRWISRNCPGAKVSGGIANLSFSFQGNEGIRAALHSVFLKHAEDAGLSLAIVNPGTMIPYDSLDPALRTAAEDLILCRKPQAAEELLQFALPKTEKAEGEKKLWRTESPENRIIHAMLKGIDDYIEADVLELRPQVPKPLDIIEGPLMEGMRKVGDLFGEGKLFLPQVIRSARVMQKAVSALTPYLGQEKKGTGKILLATVKGDVHDIGKNFVGVVLSCNGWEVLDLGVMVPAEKIAETARQERADLVGLSGLITPSLDEMIRTAQEMNRQGLRIPLLIGGATASLAHTALRIAPEYSGPVVYIRDASRSAQAVRALLSPLDREPFLAKLQTEYQQARDRHAQLTEKRNLLSFAEARRNRFIPNWSLPQNNPEPKVKGVLNLSDYPISRAAPYLDWQAFLGAWDAGPAGGETLLKDAQDLLEDIQTEGLLTLRGALGFFPAASVNEDALIFDAPEGKEIARFSFLRDQRKKSPGEKNLCLADFLPQADEKAGPIRAPGWLGAFVLSAGFGLEKAQTGPDEYRRLLLGTLANALTEAFAEEIHQRVRREWWGYSPNENLSKEELFAGKYPGLRPALGYPVCPDHQDKGIVLNLLDPEGRCGFTLTESGMLIPGAAVCGLYFAHPEARYFGLGPIGADQLQDWAIRKNLSLPAAEKRIASL